ncbi:hypothetical protein [Mucilaginibacter gilvus]|uniref:hypothetical protein n=1 Tax=Mucilaginibacter gilvus TaxID=2305909 RepID=UPI001419C9CB|nr:hypothetical protein [Mucilaginibacter gilvus]
MKTKSKVNLTVKNLFTFKPPHGKQKFFETTTIDPTTTTTTSVSTFITFGREVA